MERAVRLVVEVRFDDAIYDAKELTKKGSCLFYDRDIEGTVVAIERFLK